MEIEVTARSDGIPDRAKEYARERVAKVSRIFDRVGRIHVSLEVGKDESEVHAVVHLESGSTLVADQRHGELRMAIDLLSDKLERRVCKEKERLIDRHRQSTDEPGAPPDAGDPSYDDVIREDLERE
ncbi:MAG: ribosomal subunit interface protein [Planctomycetes bacterium]|nr:ribosomal subunit interface protein [Planctomycetota bacterium]